MESKTETLPDGRTKITFPNGKHIICGTPNNKGSVPQQKRKYQVLINREWSNNPKDWKYVDHDSTERTIDLGMKIDKSMGRTGSDIGAHQFCDDEMAPKQKMGGVHNPKSFSKEERKNYENITGSKIDDEPKTDTVSIENKTAKDGRQYKKYNSPSAIKTGPEVNKYMEVYLDNVDTFKNQPDTVVKEKMHTIVQSKESKK